MKFLSNFFSVMIYNGVIVPIGILCIALFHSGKLPNFMGPVGYGITALGTCGLIRYIIMDMESHECDQLIGEAKNIKLTLKQNEIKNKNIDVICENVVEIRKYLQGFRQDSEKLEDRVLSLEQRADMQRGKTNNSLKAGDQSNSENQDSAGHPSWRKTDCEVENELKYYENVERYHNMQMQDIQEKQQMKMLYQEMHIKKEAKNKDNALIIYLEKADDYFTGELGNISHELKNMNEDFLKLGHGNEASPYDKTILQIITKKREKNETEDENLKGMIKGRKDLDSVENVETQKRTEGIENKYKEKGNVEHKCAGDTSIQYWEKVELELKTAGRLVEIEIRGKVVESDKKIGKLEKNTGIELEKIDSLRQEEELGREKAFSESECTEQEEIRKKCENQQKTVAKLKMVENKTEKANTPEQKIELGPKGELKFKLPTNVEKQEGGEENAEIKIKEKNINLEVMMQEDVKDTTKETDEGNFEETKQKKNEENFVEMMQKRKDLLETTVSEANEGNIDETIQERKERNIEEAMQEREDVHLDKTTHEKENELIAKAIQGEDVHLEETMQGKYDEHLEKKLKEKNEGYLEETMPEKDGHMQDTTPAKDGCLDETMPERDGCLEETIPERKGCLEGPMLERDGPFEETMPERDEEKVEENIKNIQEK